MRAQTLSDTADSKSALAPLAQVFASLKLETQNSEPGALEPPPDLNVERLFVRAYALVSAALLLSAAVAILVPAQKEEDMLSNQVTLQFLFFFEIACVAVLSRYVPKLPSVWAAIVLFVCAAVNGASFTSFFQWIPASASHMGSCSADYLLPRLQPLRVGARSISVRLTEYSRSSL